VRVTLAGPDISAETSTCRWAAGQKVFQCSIKTPHAVRTGKSHPYRITATENLGAGSHAAPAVSHGVNPEVIYFK